MTQKKDVEKDSSRTPTMEDLLERTGGYGPYQIALTFATVYPQLAGAMIVLSPVFTSTNKVPLYCSDQTNFNSSQCDLNCTVPDGDLTMQSIVQEWDLVCSRSWMVEAVTSCQMAGMMVGAMVASFIADSFGRCKGFYFVTTTMGIFGMLPALALNPVLYAVARFLAGFGVGGSFVVCYVHLMEFLTPAWRTVCGCVSLMPAGEMLLALLAYLIPSWRLLTVATAAPVLVLVISYPFIQESPRWLLTQKRPQDVHKVLCRIAKWNRRPVPELATIETIQSRVLAENETAIKGLASVREIWHQKKLRVQLSILTWTNVVCTTVYYAIAFNTKFMSGSPYLNMLYMGILDFFVLPSVALFNDRIGRQRTFLLFNSLATMCLGAALVLNLWHDFPFWTPTMVTVAALIARYGIGCTGGTVRCITLESFPTTLRSSCLGFTVFASYFGAIMAPQILLLSEVSAGLPYAVCCGLTSISAVLSFFLYEMTGAPLEDTLRSSKV